MVTMSRSVLLAIAVFALEASAFWRLPCRQRLSLERVDPIDTPGTLAHHVHTIHGGNAFSKSSTNAELRASDCSSCEVKEDKSAYWTPNLYWERPDGKMVALNQTGGMLVYYLLRGDNVQPFPPDFRVIAGDNRLRNYTWDNSIQKSDWASRGLSTNQPFLRQKAIGFNCLNYNAPAQAALGLNKIPVDRECPDGLRAEVFFPSCWNGVDADSHDHRSHMAYPSTMDDGDCPESHPVRLPSLFFETIWNVNVVAGMGGRLVFSNGDPTGCGYHGDFMNGWQQDVLTRAIEKCTDPSGIVDLCQEFTLYTPSDYEKCVKPPSVNEDVWGPLEMLPGCNSIYNGPGYAPRNACDNATDSIPQGGSTIKNDDPTNNEASGPGGSEIQPKPKPKPESESESEPETKPKAKSETCQNNPHVVVATTTTTLTVKHKKTAKVVPGYIKRELAQHHRRRAFGRKL